MPRKAKQTRRKDKSAEASKLGKNGTKPASPAEKHGEAAKAVSRRRERDEVAADAGNDRPTRRRRTSRGSERGGGPGGVGLGAGSPESDSQAMPMPSRLGEDSGVDEEIGHEAEKYLDAVVKVFCVHSEPNFSMPWQRKRQISSTSSGFVIPGKKILTNAHSVEHHTQVKVRRRGSDTKFVAKVLAQGPECDIALLTVEDESFWDEGTMPVNFGKLPRLQDSIALIGYPIGGDSISASSGVVSRIEVTTYSHGATSLLGMQIDAAINSGNSGGPAFNRKGECVGIAFQSLRGDDAENIGYVIPVDVVQHFITDFERNGGFTGFPVLGIDWQKMENPCLRRACGMKAGQKGVLIREVEPASAAMRELKKGDVIFRFDGTEIANDGTIQFRSGERISFSYLVSRRFVGEKAEIEILREGEVLRFELQLSALSRLIPEHIDQRPPSYLLLAGFVFTQVTAPYLRSEYGKEYEFDSPVKLLDILLHGKAQRPGQQVVVLAHVLAAESTVGYEDLQNYQVFKVNGRKVDNLRELVEAVDACASEFLRFDLQYNATVVIDTAVAKAATPEVMAVHYIAQDRSADLHAA